MNNNRNMFYSNYQSGAFNEPMYTEPSGYNMTANYQAFGPNVMPMPNGMNPNGNINNTYTDEYDTRITKLERQIKRINERLKKLETSTLTDDDIIVDSNMYMI